MRFDILTIFPKIIDAYSSESILKRGQAAGHIKIAARDFRKFATDKRHKVDDKPYGGGPGMILKPEPIYRQLENLGLVKNGKRYKIPRTKTSSVRGAQDTRYKILALDPAGKKFDQKMARRFSKLDRLVLICGRYEGFDERIYKFVDEKVSVGDYILSGGELGALVITEAVARLLPGVLGNEESLKEETFSHGTWNMEHGTKFRRCSMLRASCSMKEYPQYTRPENFMGLKVPKILLSGNHKKIAEWRKTHNK